MTQINTSNYQALASRLRQKNRSYISTTNQNVVYRHRVIQQKLNDLTKYFNDSAILYEQNEKSTIFKDGHFRFTHHEKINVPAILKKEDKKSYIDLGFQYNFKEAQIGFKNDYLNANLRMNVGDAKVNVDSEFSLWKDKKFDPKFEAELDADIALASANLNVDIGNKYLSADVDARGAIGALYADAKCVLSKDEQSFEAGIGACALRGEASISFNVFGVKITLTGQGSIGSAEANISYHHRNKEWEFGSKLGFIAGLGFKVRVNY